MHFNTFCVVSLIVNDAVYGWDLSFRFHIVCLGGGRLFYTLCYLILWHTLQ
jgi:hypothetical protein